MAVSAPTSASAPLATSDRCDAASPNARRLSKTHCISRPGSPTNTSSITARSYQRFTVTIGLDAMREAAATIGAIGAVSPTSSDSSANHGTAATTRGIGSGSPRTSTPAIRPASILTRASAFSRTSPPLDSM